MVCAKMKTPFHCVLDVQRPKNTTFRTTETTKWNPRNTEFYSASMVIGVAFRFTFWKAYFCGVFRVKLWKSYFDSGFVAKSKTPSKVVGVLVSKVGALFFSFFCTRHRDAITRPVLCRNALFIEVSEPAFSFKQIVWSLAVHSVQGSMPYTGSRV